MRNFTSHVGTMPQGKGEGNSKRRQRKSSDSGQEKTGPKYEEDLRRFGKYVGHEADTI